MLGRTHRLSKSHDISQVFKLGRRFVSGAVVLYVLPKKSGPGRIACVCGKNVSPLAVRRHYQQRRLRELSREALGDFSLKCCDMVWLGRPGITKIKNFKNLQAEIWPLLQKIAKVCG